MKTLYPYQREGVAFLQARRKILLADEMGLGKTIQVISAIPPKTPTIVVCPAVVKNVWKNEFLEMRPEFKVTTLFGRSSFRFPNENEVVITNYDILPEPPKDKKAFSKPLELPLSMFRTVAIPGTYLVCDEAHILKNKKTKAWKIIKKLSADILAAKGKTWPLTATPLLNRPAELWALLDAFYLAGTVFEGGYDDFCKSFNAIRLLRCYCHQNIEASFDESFISHTGTVCASFAKTYPTEQECYINTRQREFISGLRSRGHKFGLPNETVSPRLRRIMLRRERKDVLPDLPAKTYNDILIDIPKEASKEYDDLMSILPPKEEWPENIEAFSKLFTSTQSAITLLTSSRKIIAESKIPYAIEWLEPFEQEGIPIVVFSAHRLPVEILGKRKGWNSILGDTPTAKRNSIVEQFQAGQRVGLCATIQSGGVGITLTRACHALFIDDLWTPSLNEQAEDRLYRIGQKSAVCIHRLILDHPVERHVRKITARKKTLIHTVLAKA